MEINQNIGEYYDELYPVTEEQKVFYEKKKNMFKAPAKFLSIGCGTGTLEHNLAREGSDVTGLETSVELLESANRKRRTQLMSVRYFQMSSLEMTRFLGKGFYNVISILHDRIIYIHDKVLMEKLFYDCRQLISENGLLIIKLTNFSNYKNQQMIKLPVRESIRSSLATTIEESGDKYYANQILENSSGKKLKVTVDAPVYLLQPEEIKEFSLKAGFSRVDFYSDFSENPFFSDSREVLAVISA